MKARENRIWLVLTAVLGSFACAYGAYDILVQALVSGEFCPVPKNSPVPMEAMRHCKAAILLDRFIDGFLASSLIAVSSLAWIWWKPKQ